RSFFLMPLRNSVLGPSASKPQSVVVLSSLVTVTHSQECGLVYSNSLTTPLRVMVLTGSNMAPEWCAPAAMHRPARTPAATALFTISCRVISFPPSGCPDGRRSLFVGRVSHDGPGAGPRKDVLRRSFPGLEHFVVGVLLAHPAADADAGRR